MTWDEACKEIQKGKDVARPNWKAAWVYQSKHRWLGLSGATVSNVALGGHFSDPSMTIEMGEFPYSYPNEDTKENDWYVITDPKYYTNTD